jgi:16S rRNA (cytosine967-C5)-methyltransferase
MDGVPAYAAISQTVDQVRAVAGESGSRLANGVLRSLDREGGEVDRFPPFPTDPENYLCTWGSHPAWLIRRWLGRWEPEDVLRLVELDNSPAELFFRPLGVPLEEAGGLLAASGYPNYPVAPEVPCLQLVAGTIPAKILENVPGVFQDPGAALVTVYADAPRAGPVGDLCAAPGGKALALAEGGAYVLAADRSLSRLRLLRENLSRVGGRVDLVAALAQHPPFKELPFVLLDVPCSGTGTLRRHPDARWRLSPEMLNRLRELQKEVLEAGSRLVPEGGVLVYSTCSLEREENHGQVEAFLSRHPMYALEETGMVAPEYVDDRGFLSVLPQASGFDGAFAARMVRGS